MASNADGIKPLLTELQSELLTLEKYLKEFNCEAVFKVYSTLEENVHTLLAKTGSLQNEKEAFVNTIKMKLLELIQAMKEANKIKKENEDYIRSTLQTINENARSVGIVILDFNTKIRRSMEALNEEVEKASRDQDIERGAEEVTEMIDELLILIKKN